MLADLLLGHQPVGAVEIEPYCQQVLSARQKDGILPWFPIFADVKEFDGKPWRGKVDIISGGFPCQDISCAGKGAGLAGERSGLWSEMARIIGEVRPRFVLVENSPMLVSRGLEVCLSDLAEMGYDARWGVVGADDVGAPHRRKRIWIVANAMRERSGSRWPECERQRGWRSLEQSSNVADAESRENDRRKQGELAEAQGQRKCIDTTSEPCGENVADAHKAGLQGRERTGGTDKAGREKQNGSASECRCSWWDQDPADMAHTGIPSTHPHAEELQPRNDSSGESGGRVAQSAVGRVAHGVDSGLDIP